MPFYELICITRAGHQAITEAKDVARIAGRVILNSNGVIRDIKRIGLLPLPQRAKAHNAWHYEGFYFLMWFYAGPFVLRDLDRHLKVDPRMVRFNVIKLGERLDQMVKIPGEAGIRSH